MNKITEWNKKCPRCGNIQFYSNRFKLKYALQSNTVCKKCMYNSTEYKQKISSSMKGVKFTDEHRKNLSKSHKHFITKETKLKIANSMLNRKLTEHHKENIKNTLKNSNHKERLRKCMLRRMETLNIPPNEDDGAKEWFEKYNKETNSNFQPKSFKEELGYIADGYDENKHIWIEYDTKYHSSLKQNQKDKIRQNNIIEYFIKTNKPLNGFWRILSYENNQIKIIV